MKCIDKVLTKALFGYLWPTNKSTSRTIMKSKTTRKYYRGPLKPFHKVTNSKNNPLYGMKNVQNVRMIMKTSVMSTIKCQCNIIEVCV